MNDPTSQVTSFLEKLDFQSLWFQNGLQAWLVFLVGAAGGLVVGRLTAAALIRIARRCEARGWDGRAQTLLGMASPACLVILTLGLQMGVGGLRMSKPLGDLVPPTFLLLYNVAVFWYVYNLIGILGIVISRVGRAAESALGRHLVALVQRTLRICVVVFGALAIGNSVLGLNVGAWLAGLGIAGLAVSLAAQDSLKHVFGSLAILLDRPFGIGDRIVSCGYEGTIEDIGFRSTKIRTSAGHLVTLPNSSLVNGPIENISRRPAIRRVVELVIAGRPTRGSVDNAKRLLSQILAEDGIREPISPVIAGVERPPRVLFADIPSGNSKLTLTYWYAPPADADFTAHAERLNLRIVEEFEKAGIELTQTAITK